jgi:phage FluMu protein gp41
MTLEEMTAQRDALFAARFAGIRTVEYDGKRVTYASDAEMAAAITDLERRIAGLGEGGRKRRILTSASKGL